MRAAAQVKATTKWDWKENKLARVRPRRPSYYAAARLCFKLPVERDYENYRPRHSSQPRQPSSRTLEAILFK